jgi:acyl carrier protein
MSSDQMSAAKRILAGIIHRDESTIHAADRLSDLGLDSLDRVLLAVLLEEESGQPIPDERLITVATVADIEAHLAVTARDERAT